MSHRDHIHREALRRRPSTLSARLPGDQFGALVGVFDHATLAPHDGERPDDNHIYLHIRIDLGPLSGKYEVAVNTESNDHTEVQFAIIEEEVESDDIPQDGFAPASIHYPDLGLSQADFQDIENGRLRGQLKDLAVAADKLAAYGISYSRGDGLHDVHMNHGNRPDSGFENQNRDNQDGAVVFYFFRGRPPKAVWVFLKFSTQDI